MELRIGDKLEVLAYGMSHETEMLLFGPQGRNPEINGVWEVVQLPEGTEYRGFVFKADDGKMLRLSEMLPQSLLSKGLARIVS